MAKITNFHVRFSLPDSPSNEFIFRKKEEGAHTPVTVQRVKYSFMSLQGRAENWVVSVIPKLQSRSDLSFKDLEDCLTSAGAIDVNFTIMNRMRAFQQNEDDSGCEEEVEVPLRAILSGIEADTFCSSGTLPLRLEAGIETIHFFPFDLCESIESAKKQLSGLKQAASLGKRKKNEDEISKEIDSLQIRLSKLIANRNVFKDVSREILKNESTDPRSVTALDYCEGSSKNLDVSTIHYYVLKVHGNGVFYYARSQA